MAMSKLKMRLIVAIVVALMFASCLGALIFFEVPETNADILKVLVGFLGGAFVTMVAFYFGDSAGKD